MTGRAASAATRAALLAAARRQFSRAGYDHIGMREIAARARGDKKLITHYFGSKERLFAEALDSSARKFQLPDARAWVAFGEYFSRRIFGRSDLSDADRHEFISLCVHSAASPVGKRIVSHNVTHQIRQIAGQLRGRDADVRASILVATVLGISLLREVLKSEPLAGLSVRKASRYIGPLLQMLVDRPLPLRRARPAMPLKDLQVRSASRRRYTSRAG